MAHDGLGVTSVVVAPLRVTPGDSTASPPFAYVLRHTTIAFLFVSTHVFLPRVVVPFTWLGLLPLGWLAHGMWGVSLVPYAQPVSVYLPVCPPVCLHTEVSYVVSPHGTVYCNLTHNPHPSPHPTPAAVPVTQRAGHSLYTSTTPHTHTETTLPR